MYDFIFPKRSMNNMDNSTNTTSIRSFSLFGQSSSDMDDNGGCMLLHVAGGGGHILRKFQSKEFIGKQLRKDTSGPSWME